MKSETVIHTLRHAHTAFNAEGRYAGSVDVPLSESGQRDARLCKPSLDTLKIDIVIVSELQRAQQTARILMGEHVLLVCNALCNERRFGVLEGLTWQEAKQLQPPVLTITVGGDFHTVNPQGGEPLEDVWQRAKQFRELILQTYAGSHILVVSHGVFLQMFHGLLRGLSCIEALAVYPGNLELNSFRLKAGRLASEESRKLVAGKNASW